MPNFFQVVWMQGNRLHTIAIYGIVSVCYLIQIFQHLSSGETNTAYFHTELQTILGRRAPMY